MEKKKVVLALGHKALGTTLPEQMTAVKGAAKAVADLVEEGCQLAICHSNAPQVGMIHTALNEFGKVHQDYTFAPMSVCSAMSQGYIGYDLQNAIREELLSRGILKPVSTIITQVVVDPYDDAFAEPIKVIGRYMTAEEAAAEEEKGNFVVEEKGKGFRRIVAAPKPKDIVEIDAIRALLDADQQREARGASGRGHADDSDRPGEDGDQLWNGSGKAAGCGESGRGGGVRCGGPVPESFHSAEDGGGRLLRVWPRGPRGSDRGAYEGPGSAL